MDTYEAEKYGFEFDERVLVGEKSGGDDPDGASLIGLGKEDSRNKRSKFTIEKACAKGNLATLVKDHALKTGTTICGCLAKDCVVLAADTRSTMQSLVASKHCFKLHKLSPNIWCAGAGVSADLEHVTLTLAAELQILTQQMGRMPRVETCVTRLCNKLFKYQGHIVTALIIGGVNPTGEMSLFYVSPEGYSHSLPYMAMGSGGYFAQGILEAHYKENMSKEEAKNLCGDAIEAGVLNDLGSGTGCDVVVISMEDPMNPVLTRAFRNTVAHQKVAYSRPPFAVGSVAVIKESRRTITPFQANKFTEYL